MILDLVPSASPVLRTESEPFDFENPQRDPLELARDMEETMRAHQGLGLSACQVGIPLRVFSLRSEPDATLFNPRIVDASEQEVDLDEGCLSFRGFTVKVRRPRIIKLRFQLPDGDTRTLKLDGITARAVLHEMDHLNGYTLVSGLGRARKQMLIRKAAKAGYHYNFNDLRD